MFYFHSECMYCTGHRPPLEQRPTFRRASGHSVVRGCISLCAQWHDVEVAVKFASGDACESDGYAELPAGVAGDFEWNYEVTCDDGVAEWCSDEYLAHEEAVEYVGLIGW